MMKAMKTLIRDNLPRRYQVPAKYWYGAIRGTIEPEMSLLDRLIGHGAHAVDIGGNRGLYSYRMRQLGARVEVFEPNSVCLSVLAAWAAGKPGVTVHPVALSSRSGSASLHVPIDDAGIAHDASGSIEHGYFPKTQDQAVETRTLDSYGFTGIDFIKIDVEGHEHSVIEGAVATMAASHPALLVEIEQRHNARPISDVFAKITGLGYDGFFLSRGQLAALARFDAGIDQARERLGASGRYVNNFLFLHRQRIEAGHYPFLFDQKAQA